ncbi:MULTISPECIES: sensor histidine kinase [unclassified Aureimonas]|uniref:sensor histidine kinase n=1 Tax=unclassified Aureimonas TaxID=2615206 RepID=UPI0006FA06CC|nr:MULTISPECIES: sensor histidine kinase [unclassified Aureimonas]KQT55349.1 histidine kinase [Aureimonas sp. Leaf427]KQT71140.1 histidine kinase [Aureimonas sp. Leaf460]
MTISNRFFERFILLAILLGFLGVGLGVGAAVWGVVRSHEISDLVTHTLEVELSLAEFRGLTERSETARRGFLLDADERFASSAAEAAASATSLLERVAQLTKDNPAQEVLVAELRKASQRQLDDVSRAIEARRIGDPESARNDFIASGSADVVREIREIARRMTAAEQRLLAERRSRQEASIRTSYLILAAAGGLVLLLAAGTVWTVRRSMRELKGSRDTLAALNENLEGAVASRTADLQRANDEIQRFAYIVSHDLRSPLVNVMGFTAELDAATKPLGELIDRLEADAPDFVTEPAKLAVREDLPEAIGFIRSSTQKMDRLINAILRLSREGRRIITPEPLDIGEMADGIVASLRHRLDEIGAEVEVVRPMPGLVSDRVAVEQIFSNLVENAVKYLKPGRPGRITVRGRSEKGRILYEIEDNGRGIDPKDHERIFDLFRRSGMQDQPGEGIGLAHVRALAYRLGGMVSCESQLDRGATFGISMPPRYHANKEQAR